ncbi:MAG: FeoA domain-containing protein [Bryobacterales bacterium]|nr:FeoA domain-containing protein [Bryobacterales bacterium]
MSPSTPAAIGLELLLLGAAGALGAWAVCRGWRQRRQDRQRALAEDVLKHIFTAREEGRQADAKAIAGRLAMAASKVSAMLARMEAQGLVRSDGDALRLTPEGEQRALHVVRAHRLWETYLAHQARLPTAQLHKPAEKEEHRLTPAQVEELEARLGHPARDPHGDPIPSASGHVVAQEIRALAEWPAGERAEIVHVEDEPETVFRGLADQGLHAGQVVRITARRPEAVTFTDGERQYELTPLEAAQIQVAAVSAESADCAGLVRLSQLRIGEEAEVRRLDPQLQGLTRRRLLDLGLTPGARVTAVLSNAFGDPRAFRVRGTTVALRNDQAALVWVRPYAEPDHQAEASQR